MYKIYCQGRKNSKWKEYSREYESLEEVEEAKRKSEELQVCDVYGNIIKYKIVTVNQ